MLTITRKIEFDAGHRIPDHRSQCRNMHGHRYVLHITLEGNPVDQDGHAANGMILDFSDVKKLAEDHLVSKWDHAFLVYEKDTAVRDFLESLPDHKTVVLDKVPTAENLASIAFRLLKDVYADFYGNALALKTVRIYETPNCWAEVTAETVDV